MVGLLALGLGITVHAQNISVSTGGAVDVSPFSAVLQGTVSTDYYGSFRPPVAYIEYGPTDSFGFTTVPRTFTSTQPIIRELVEGLTPNTQYYVRAVTQSASQGIQRGNTITFVTLKSDGSPGDVPGGNSDRNSGGNTGGNTGGNNGNSGGGINIGISGNINNNTNNNGGNGSGGNGQLVGGSFASKLFLDINDGFDTFTEQDILTYEITAANITEDDLDEIYVVVEVSDQVAYLGDNARGIYRPENHEVVFTLGDLDEDEGRKFQINVRPINELTTGDRIVMKALAVYTDPATSLQYQTIDYDVNTFNLEGNTVVVTTETEERRGLPVFVVLLIVVILIAIIVILGRKIYLKYKEEQEKDDQAEDLYDGLLQDGQNQPGMENNDPMANMMAPATDEGSQKSVFDGMDDGQVDAAPVDLSQPQQPTEAPQSDPMQRNNDVAPPGNLPG